MAKKTKKNELKLSNINLVFIVRPRNKKAMQMRIDTFTEGLFKLGFLIEHFFPMERAELKRSNDAT